MGKSYVLESDDFFCPNATCSVKGFLAVPCKATPNTHLPALTLPLSLADSPLIPALKYSRLHTDVVYWLSQPVFPTRLYVQQGLLVVFIQGCISHSQNNALTREGSR